MSDHNNKNHTFHRHRLQYYHRHWCRIISSSNYYRRGRRHYYFSRCVKAIAIAALSSVALFTTITTRTRQYAYYHEHQHQRGVVDDGPPIAIDDQHDAASTFTVKIKNNVVAIQNQNRHVDKNNNNNGTQVAAAAVVTHTDKNNQDQEAPPHNYGVLLTHYHKTGYVLSRHLMQLVIDLEYKSHGMTSPLRKNAHSVQGKRSIQKLKKVDHIDKDTGMQIAFGQRGNWITSFVPARRHSAITGCPPFFTLDVGAMHVQESPDLFCDDEELIRLLFGIGGGGDGWNELFMQYHSKRSRGNLPSSSQNKKGIGDDDTGHNDDDVSGNTTGVKIVHFVRNPFEMALSNYLYHSQEPTPESWVHTDNPCEVSYNSSGKKSLASFTLPLLSTRTKITSEQLDAIIAMCHSLYQSNSTSSSSSSTSMPNGNLENATFYEHLIKLNRGDGLRLATAQMVISSSAANGHLAGGDILRMGQNVIKFENLRALLSLTITKRKLHILTLSMEDYTASVKNTTLQFLDFLLGGDGHNDNNNKAAIVPKRLRVKAAEDFEYRNDHSKKGEHVTLGKYDDREDLIQLLREDSILGPVLNEIEILVDEVVRKSK